jgi:hypothetical protein
MKEKKRKLEPPFHLDMSFDEALTRYAETKPEEVKPAKGRPVRVAPTTDNVRE